MSSDRVTIASDALVPANSLRNNNLQKKGLTEVITDIIRHISQELVEAHRECRHHVIATMPITFNIPSMSNKDSQRSVWSSVIDELLGKGYRVWVSPGKDTCRIKITWLSDTDETDIIYQNKLIAKHTKQF